MILGLSGGVDSSVVAALCARAIGKQLTCVFVNHGLLRKNEPEEVEAVFTQQFGRGFRTRARRGSLRGAPGRRDRTRGEAPHHRLAVLAGVLRGGAGAGRGRPPGEVPGAGNPSTPTSSRAARARPAAKRPPSRAITI